MARISWNGKRTLDHCSVITNCVRSGMEKPKQYDGKCEGYAGSDGDEPCSKCRECKLNVWYEE